MSERGSTIHWPDRRERILALASELAEARTLEKIDLNQVDGEFFWKICRDDVFSQLSAVAAAHAPRRAEGRTRIEQVYSDVYGLETNESSSNEDHPFITDYLKAGMDAPV